jgi:DNA-binding response OmpR family regulator
VCLFVLSGRSFDAADRLAAVNAGADDHIPKMHGTEEIAVRIRIALARRERESQDPDRALLRYGPLVVNLATTQVLVNGLAAPAIRGTQYRLLTCLMERPERMVRWEEMEQRVFGARVSGGARNNSVFRLRGALGIAAGLVVTEPGCCGLFLPHSVQAAPRLRGTSGPEGLTA